MHSALRAAIDQAIAGSEEPPDLHFLAPRTRGPGGYRRLVIAGRRPQPGEALAADGEVVGIVAGVSAWWVNVPAGGRIVVTVYEVR